MTHMIGQYGLYPADHDQTAASASRTPNTSQARPLIHHAIFPPVLSC
ncbi:MAG TPA: hypothetical protein VFI90_19835 [Rubrobacter sp.]|nr:hypothetical protein [Rubrobacter sp.]